MVFFRFSLPAFYVALIAFALSFLWGMLGFLTLMPMVGNEDFLAEVFMPSWVFGFGVLLIIVEYWWRLSDSKATIVLWGIKISLFGYIIAGIGVVLFAQYIIENGLFHPMIYSLLFTATLSGILIMIYQQKKKQMSLWQRNS